MGGLGGFPLVWGQTYMYDGDINDRHTSSAVDCVCPGSTFRRMYMCVYRGDVGWLYMLVCVCYEARMATQVLNGASVTRVYIWFGQIQLITARLSTARATAKPPLLGDVRGRISRNERWEVV